MGRSREKSNFVSRARSTIHTRSRLAPTRDPPTTVAMLNSWRAIFAATALTVTATATLSSTVTNTNAARPQHTQLALRRHKHNPWHFYFFDANNVIPGLLHVWEAELHDRWFSRASRELGVPLTAARGIATSAHPDSCTRALCAGAGIQVRRQTGNALERGRYTGFANRLPGAGMAGAR